MQILNTDFRTNTQECVLPRDAIQQFRAHFLERQKRSDANTATKESNVADNRLGHRQEGEVAGLSRLWWHSYILSERMLLNYSRYESRPFSFPIASINSNEHFAF